MAKNGPIKQVAENKWVVASQTQPGMLYELEVGPKGTIRCSCQAGQRGGDCKHKRMLTEGVQPRFGNNVPAEAAKAKEKQSVTKHGYPLDEVTSAMHKEIRLADEEAALFWGLELYEAAPYYFWKRVLIQAAEDVGLADPYVVVIVSALAKAWEFCKQHSRWYVDPEHVVMALLVLCRAQKSTEVDDAKTLVDERMEAGLKLEVPDYALDVHTKRGKEMGRKGWAECYAFREKYAPGNPYMERLREEFPEAVGVSDAEPAA